MSQLMPRAAPLVAGVLFLAVAGRAAAQDTRMPAADVTAATIADGRMLYQGAGGCAACHGDDGMGTADGPSLKAGRWKLGDGTFPWLVHMTRHAGWGAANPQADPKPMRGPGTLDSTQVRSVAAYVFSISRAKSPPARAR
jgi:mono/diheme cytochrome c family protein